MPNWLRIEELVRLAAANVVAGCAKPGNVTNDELREARGQLQTAVRLLDERDYSPQRAQSAQRG